MFQILVTAIANVCVKSLWLAHLRL